LKQYDQNITFELNEKLSFETGQEIDEMISISLDPDIVVQSYDDYIQIRGVILLSGEYHRSKDNSYADELSPQNANRYMERVVNLDKHVAGFSHRFPVEISVTKERVKDLDDIIVKVDSFDYDLPSNNTLNVFASLHIHGITPEKQVESTNQSKNEPENEKEKSTEKVDQAHQNQHMESETTKQSTEVETKSVNKNDSKEPQVVDVMKKESTDKSAKNKSDHASTEKSTTNEERSLKLVKSESGTNDDTVQKQMANEGYHEQEEQTNQQPKHTEPSTEEQVIDVSKQMAEEKSENEQESKQELEQAGEMQIELMEGKEDEETDIKDVAFLTELFEEEEETYTQVTIYITQPEDSIESIAKRYEIPVLQLLKDNNLSADTIEEGQLITIRQQSMS